MNKLVHPATTYLNHLPMEMVPFRELSADRQQSMFDYMVAEGDGVWASHVNDVDEAVEKFGDVVFGTGTITNDDEFKTVVAITDGYFNEGDTSPVESFMKSFESCDAATKFANTPVLSPAGLAPEFGLFENPEAFSFYWFSQPEIPFVAFPLNWKIDDMTGRGGQ